MYFEPSGSCGHKVTTIYLQCSTAAFPSLIPVQYRLHFKICLLTYKALYEEQPIYLCSLIATSLPSRSLRSYRWITLSVPRIKTNTGARLFSSCAPSLWNNLPLSVCSVIFRRRLKTYLFDLPSLRRHWCVQQPVEKMATGMLLSLSDQWIAGIKTKVFLLLKERLIYLINNVSIFLQQETYLPWNSLIAHECVLYERHMTARGRSHI